MSNEVTGRKQLTRYGMSKGASKMKEFFVEPSYEVVRFNYNIITASGCSCVVGIIDFHEANECEGFPDTKNNPECTCILDDPVNCW